jgi:hypothetical protein
VGVQFSCFALLAISRAPGPVSMFCAPRLILCGTRGIRSSFSCFAQLESFSAISRALCPILMFCTPRLVLGVLGAPRLVLGVQGSNFHVLRNQNSFSTVSRAPFAIFKFCGPRPVFGGKEGVVSNLEVLRSQTHFGRYEGRRV